MCLMNETFADLLDTFVIIYLDDILIFSPDMTTHEEHLATVLQRLRDNHLYANTEKTTLVVPEVDFLGHHVCRGQITLMRTRSKLLPLGLHHLFERSTILSWSYQLQ